MNFNIFLTCYTYSGAITNLQTSLNLPSHSGRTCTRWATTKLLRSVGMAKMPSQTMSLECYGRKHINNLWRWQARLEIEGDHCKWPEKGDTDLLRDARCRLGRNRVLPLGWPCSRVREKPEDQLLDEQKHICFLARILRG